MHRRNRPLTQAGRSARRGSTLALLGLALGLIGSPGASASSYTIVAGGAPVTVKTTVADENATASFSGSAGQRISLKMSAVTIGSSGCCSTKVSIRKPGGANLVAPFYVGRTGRFMEPKTLPADGTYRIFVDPQDSAKGAMTLTLYDVPPDATTSIVPDGTPVALSTTTPGQNARATFAANEGDRVSLELSGFDFSTSATAGATVSILNPDNTVLTPGTAVGTAGKFIDTKVLPQTGTYAVVVNPTTTNVGTGTLTLFGVPADSTGVLALGTPAAFETTVPGQNVAPTFAGTQGQRVSFRLTDVAFGASTCCDARFSVLGPDGGVVSAAQNVGVNGLFSEPVALPATGSYTVRVDPQEMRTGSLTIAAYEVPPDATASMTPGGSPATLTTTAPGQNAVATFTGVAGKRISLVVSDVSIGASGCCGARLTIEKPDGSVLKAATWFGTNGYYVDATTLPVSGTYEILLDPHAEATGSATLALYDVPADVGGSIAYGGSASPSLSVPGQNARLSFAGVAGQRVALRLSNVTIGSSSCCGAKLSLLKPDGSLLTAATSFGTNGAFIDPKALPVTGTYKILVDPIGSATGGATITLYNVPADSTAAIATSGSPVTVSPAVGQNAWLTFSGVAGQRVSLSISNVTIGAAECCSASVRFYKPDGLALGLAESFGTSGEWVEPKTLPVTGTYKILVDPQADNAGSATVRLWSVPADTTAAIAFGGSTTVTLSTPGQNGTLTFSGTAGRSVTLTASAVSMAGSACCSAQVSLLGPTGARVGGTMFFGTTGGSQSWTLPANGSYTLHVDPIGAVTGSATFALA